MTAEGKHAAPGKGGLAHWRAVYQTRDADEVSWYQRRPQMSLRLIRSTGAGPGDPIIDVGGGASVLVDCLLAEGYGDLTVLDIAGEALSESRRRLGDLADRVTWLEADVLEYRPERVFAVWHDRALFHFMTGSAERQAYVQTLEQALGPGGQAILATFAIDGPRKCSGLEIERYDAARLMAELGSGFDLLQTVDETHRTPAGAEQKFTYFRLRRL